MGKGEFLGEFEHLVLLAVLRLADGAYGLTVRRELASETGRSVTIGADGLPLISYRDASAASLEVMHCANRSCIPWTRRR